MAEFLPLCDVLFNVISLAGYFCDVVFDLVMGYALLERGYKCTFAATISIVITSLLISQVLSLRWYLHVWWASEGRKDRPPWLPILLHCLQMGVLWRYARLLVPVELRRVKHQVRDLCMLRLVHAFCEAAPMLLLQLHILLKDADLETVSDLAITPDLTVDEPSANKAFAELNVISASLSLFSVCWALASFSKNVRLQNVHRLVLTWLGVIFQFLWRLGTVSARICALSVYALVYEYWVFLVIGLHWISMFLWLISPKNVFHGERISRPRKAYLSALIAFVYVFAYINLQEHNHRQKMVVFYCVMCVENCVLVTAWWWSWRGALRPSALAASAASATLAGLAFMLLYYRYFHVRRLGYMLGEHQQGTNSTNASSQNKNGKASQADNVAIPGVFNCRFSNPVNNSAANGRKKKKPTSFVPPPAAPPAAFWRRPLPAAHNHHGGSSENEGSSVGSRVNIQQKLQEKKQKQLAELRVIEEEIKQGKLAKTTPVAAEEIYSSLQRQPIPRAKTHAEPPAWPSIEMTHSYQNYPVLPHTCNLYPTYTEIKPEYNVPNFPTNDTNNDLKMRVQDIYDQDSRTFYENPANLRSEVPRTPLRSPNYLVPENRKYESNVQCRSPRNVLNSSPRNYLPDVSTNSYEATQNNARSVQNNSSIYSEDHRQSIGEFSGYCEDSNQNAYGKYGDAKEEYVSALHNVLANVQNIDNMRGIYNEVGCTQYGQNCDRFPYQMGGKKMEQMRKMQRCRTPEILLAPHYLEGCNRQVCCNWGAPYTNRKKEESAGVSGGVSSAGGAGGGGGAAGSSGSESGDAPARDTPRPPSDIDSQISLPRSYTLPREFRYWRRRPRLRDAHLPSNNSSDGDVDSGDNDSDRRSNCSASSQIQPPTYGDTFQYSRPDMVPRQDDRYDVYGACPDRRRRGFRKQGPKPETKL
ncbi:uncharacterized protein LOC120625328 [Pararge aegeria]|uniref:uncharacterized protein LOC120625328 n=1 Tax=Pararge aegeria TaxID=116150 RepID=UPI0019D00F46|nr:uncharacterized protein LOC120625328 [Pararge aegeria]